MRKALKEREVLLAAAPHILWPLRFVLPHDAHLRPAWMIRAGLFLYDHLTRRRLLEGSAAAAERRAATPRRPRSPGGATVAPVRAHLGRARDGQGLRGP